MKYLEKYGKFIEISTRYINILQTYFALRNTLCHDMNGTHQVQPYLYFSWLLVKEKYLKSY